MIQYPRYNTYKSLKIERGVTRKRFFGLTDIADWVSSQTWRSLATSAVCCFMIGQIIPLLPQHSHPVRMHRWRSFGNSHANRSRTREFAIDASTKLPERARARASGRGGNSNFDARRGKRTARFTRFARRARLHRNNSMYRSRNIST